MVGGRSSFRRRFYWEWLNVYIIFKIYVESIIFYFIIDLSFCKNFFFLLVVGIRKNYEDIEMSKNDYCFIECIFLGYFCFLLILSYFKILKFVEY